jgi:formate-dependent nitrite reductase membrane component NrfD
LKARRSDLMVSIFKKSQNRNRRGSRTEGIIRLLLIVLWALVVVVLGFYSGLALHHH